MNSLCDKLRPAPWLLAALLAQAGAGAVRAAEAPAAGAAATGTTDTAARLESLQQRVGEQARSMAELRRALAEQEAVLDRLRRQLEAELHGGAVAVANPTPPPPPPPPSQAAATPVAPPAPVPAPPVAAIFEQPGVLTPPGKFVFEPSLQYAYASSNRVALVGYTVIPAVLVGVIDVREVKRSTVAAAITARWGLTPRFEVEAKLPWVYRSDTSIGREVQQGSSDASVFNASGQGIGDVEVTGRYQLNQPGPDGPFYVGSLRLKSRTGTDPFQVLSSTGALGLSGDASQTTLPTGSGFYALQPALTALVPSDPAVFFGSVSYLHSIARNDVSRNTDQGPEAIGRVAPGDIFGFNFGMGVSLNDRSSFSIGYDHASVGRTRVNGLVAADSVRVQLGTLLLGYSFRLDSMRTLSVSLGAGLTRDTPDVTLTLRLPNSL